MTAAERDRREELAHGGLVKREGDKVTPGDGSQWWLNGEPWARSQVDATFSHDIAQLIRADRRRMQ